MVSEEVIEGGRRDEEEGSGKGSDEGRRTVMKRGGEGRGEQRRQQRGSEMKKMEGEQKGE